jgi:hypothetical protein
MFERKTASLKFMKGESEVLQMDEINEMAVVRTMTHIEQY